MPPRRRSSRASQKETDERWSIAETIAGLANSIEHPAISPRAVTARQNSDDKAAADFARLPSMVIEELNVPAVLPVNSQSLPLPARTASVDGIADTGGHAHVDVSGHKLRSQAGRQHIHVQSQSSVCSANVIRHSQSTSAVHTPGTSENVVYREVDRLHAVTAVPFTGDTVFSAVMVGWNPPVLASGPAGSIEPVSPDEVSSPLSALRTINPANNNSNVEVLKLSLVLEPTSDGMWQLVPVSASEAFGANLLPNTGCVVQTIAQQSEESGWSGNRTCSQPLSSNVAQAVVGTGSLVNTELTTTVNSSQCELRSVSVPGSYYNGSGACSSTVTSETCQELSDSVRCSDRVTCEPSVPSLYSSDASSSNEDAVGGSPVLGSLGALRDYYKRINTNIVQSSSLTGKDIQMLSSAACVASVENNKTSCADLKLPTVSASACNDQVDQPVPCINAVSTARSADVQTNLNVKPVLASTMTASVGDANWSLKTTSRVLPPVSLDHRQTSPSDNANKRFLTESHCNLHRSLLASALFTDGGHEQSSAKRSCKLLQHLPPKKRQKVSNDIQCEGQENGLQHKTSADLDNKQPVDDCNKNVTIDPPDILMNEEVVTLTERPSCANIAVSGTLVCQFSA